MNEIQRTDTDILQCSSLVELLTYRATHFPDDTAFIFVSDKDEHRKTITYKELDRQARCIAAHFQTDCLSGERALLLYPPGIDFIAAFFGCLGPNRDSSSLCRRNPL